MWLDIKWPFHQLGFSFEKSTFRQSDIMLQKPSSFLSAGEIPTAEGRPSGIMPPVSYALVVQGPNRVNRQIDTN